MCVGAFMAVLDIQIVASSLPEIQAGLAIPLDALSWVQTAYLIAEIIAIPLTGWLARALSTRGLFVIGVAGFAASSTACALSTSFAPFLLFRMVQGFCGGTLIPLVFSAAFLLFPERLHGRATAMGGAIVMLAPTLGPSIGGWITETTSWHWLFLINLPPGIAVALAVWRWVAVDRPQRALLRRIDLLSLALLATSLAALQVALREGPARGWADPVTLALLATCIASGTWSVRRCLAAADPIVDFRPLADPGFAVGCALSFMLGAGLYGSVYLMPLFLGFVRDLSPLEIGTVMTVTGAAQLVAAPIAAWLERRMALRLLTGCGYALLAVGLILGGFATPQTDAAALFWPQVARGTAILLCVLPTTTMALEHLPKSAVGNASGLFNLMRNLGGAIALGLIDTIVAVRTPTEAGMLVDRLKAGDATAAAFVGLPTERFVGQPMGEVDAAARSFIEPLIQRASATLAFNDAWLVIGAAVAASLLIVPFARVRRAVPVRAAKSAAQ